MIVADYTALQAITSTSEVGAQVADFFRGGFFTLFLKTNLPAGLSAKMALDTQRGWFVPHPNTEYVWVRRPDGIPSIWHFGAVPYLTVDSTAAIKGAIAVVGWGAIDVPVGNHKTTETIYLPPGAILIGRGVQHTPDMSSPQLSGSVIFGSHSGPAIISMKGAYNCSLQNICLWGDQANPPKTGLCLGRSGTGSAGRHFFSNINVVGYFTKAAIYSIASEENEWIIPRANVLGGGAQWTFFTSEADELAVDGMTIGSNFTAYFHGFNLLHQGTTANSAAVYQSLGAQSQLWDWRGGFMGMTSGANSCFVWLNLSASPLGDFTFESIGFEASSSAAPPLETFRITGAGVLKGLRIINCSEGMYQSGTQKFISVSPSVTLDRPQINCAKLSHPSTFGPVTGGDISLPSMPFYGSLSFGGVSGLRDLSYVLPCGFTGASKLTYFVEIQDGNTFRWIGNATGGLPYDAQNVPITGGEQALSNGVKIKFASVGGHTTGTFWYWDANP